MNQPIARERIIATCSPFSGYPAPPPHHSTLWEDAGGLLEYWYIACTSTQLKADQPLPSTLMGRGLVLFRDQSGQATALIDQCVHRGAELSSGTVQDGCIQCPYHGWRYNAQGQVVHIPAQDGNTEPCKPYPYQQQHFAVQEHDGFVWVFLGQTDPAQVPIYRSPYYHRPDFISYLMIGTYHGDVGTVCQVNMDVPHTVFVHGKFFRNSGARQIDATVEVEPRTVKVTYHDHDETIGPMPWLTNPDRAPLMHTDVFIAPNITQVDYHWGERSGIVFNSIATPIDAHTTRLYTLISYKFPMPKLALHALKPALNLYTKLVNQQDMAIMRTRQRGLRHAPLMREHSTPADMAHVAIERILSAIREGEDVPTRLLGTRQMRFHI